MSAVSMKQLLEAGVHFGHQTRKWNPKMDKYIFTARKDIHIIDLEQTLVLVDKAYDFIKESVKEGKTILFVGTKKQAQDAVKEEKTMGIPTVGLIDTNCDPDYITHVIPGNDDAIRSVKLIAAAMANAVIEAKEGVQLTVELPEEESESKEKSIEDIEKVFEETVAEKKEDNKE